MTTFNSDKNRGHWQVVEDFYDLGNYQLNKYKMNNGVFQLDWSNVRSAIVSGVITGILGIAGYIIGVGDIFKLDVHTLLNVGALSALTAIVSLIKSFFTTNTGTVAGIQVVSK